MVLRPIKGFYSFIKYRCLLRWAIWAVPYYLVSLFLGVSLFLDVAEIWCRLFFGVASLVSTVNSRTRCSDWSSNCYIASCSQTTFIGIGGKSPKSQFWVTLTSWVLRSNFNAAFSPWIMTMWKRRRSTLREQQVDFGFDASVLFLCPSLFLSSFLSWGPYRFPWWRFRFGYHYLILSNHLSL